jgi:hypothetical protein
VGPLPDGCVRRKGGGGKPLSKTNPTARRASRSATAEMAAEHHRRCIPSRMELYNQAKTPADDVAVIDERILSLLQLLKTVCGTRPKSSALQHYGRYPRDLLRRQRGGRNAGTRPSIRDRSLPGQHHRAGAKLAFLIAVARRPPCKGRLGAGSPSCRRSEAAPSTGAVGAHPIGIQPTSAAQWMQ